METALQPGSSASRDPELRALTFDFLAEPTLLDPVLFS